MDIKIRTDNDVPVFEIHGRVRGGDAIKLSKKLEAFVEKPGEHVILDLSRIEYIDSNWLGVLIYCLKLYREKNKDILFYITSEFIKDLFKTSNIYSMITIVDTLDFQIR